MVPVLLTVNGSGGLIAGKPNLQQVGKLKAIAEESAAALLHLSKHCISCKHQQQPGAMTLMCTCINTSA